MVLVYRVELKPIRTIRTFQEIAVFLVNYKHCVETVRINNFYGFAEKNTEVIA